MPCLLFAAAAEEARTAAGAAAAPLLCRGRVLRPMLAAGILNARVSPSGPVLMLQLSSCTMGACAQGTIHKPAGQGTHSGRGELLIQCHNGFWLSGNKADKAQRLARCQGLRESICSRPSSPAAPPAFARGAMRVQIRLARGARLPEGRASTNSTQLSAVPGASPLISTCRSHTARGLGSRPTGQGLLDSTAQK